MKKLDKARQAFDDGIVERQTANPHLADLFRLRKQLRGFIKAAEVMLKETPGQRNTYTLLALYAQYREVISEIRSIEDQSRYGEVVYDRILAPMSQDIFQSFSDLTFATLKILRELGDDRYNEVKEKYEKLTVEHGRYMKHARDSYRNKLLAIFDE